MAWIESHQSLWTHLKLKRLARELRIHRAQAIGHLHLLWWWALDNAPSGHLSSLTPTEIAEAADWPKNTPDEFVAALRLHRWLDEDGKIHDWSEYAGKLIGKRILDKERKRLARRPDVVGTSAGRPPDVTGTSDGCPPDAAGTAQVQYSTVPNQPNQGEREPHPPHACIPPLKRSEFDALADHIGVPKACAEWG